MSMHPAFSSLHRNLGTPLFLDCTEVGPIRKQFIVGYHITIPKSLYSHSCLGRRKVHAFNPFEIYRQLFRKRC